MQDAASEFVPLSANELRLLDLACQEQNDACASVQEGGAFEMPEWARLAIALFAHRALAKGGCSFCDHTGIMFNAMCSMDCAYYRSEHGEPSAGAALKDATQKQAAE